MRDAELAERRPQTAGGGRFWQLDGGPLSDRRRPGAGYEQAIYNVF
jgi:hypothetical protein